MKETLPKIKCWLKQTKHLLILYVYLVSWFKLSTCCRNTQFLFRFSLQACHKTNILPGLARLLALFYMGITIFFFHTIEKYEKKDSIRFLIQRKHIDFTIVSFNILESLAARDFEQFFWLGWKSLNFKKPLRHFKIRINVMNRYHKTNWIRIKFFEF